MKRLSVKRMLCLGLATALVLSAGCGNQSGGDGKENSSQENQAGEENGGSAGQNAARGRYREEEIDLSGTLAQVRGMRRLADGRLVLTDTDADPQVSEDEGISWKAEGSSWLEEKRGSAYMMEVQKAPDGTLAVIFNDYDDENPGIEVDAAGESSFWGGSAEEDDSDAEDQTENGEEEQNTGGVEGAGKDEGAGEGDTPQEQEDEGEEEAGSLFDLSPECALVHPDGTQTPVSLTLEEDEIYPSNFWITQDGRYFLTTYGYNIYEVKEDGSSEVFLRAQGRPQLVQFLGNLMILDGYDFETPALYDMEKKAYVEDQALADFVKENYADRQFNGGSWYDLYLFPEKENTLYLAGEKGLHRHEIGSDKVEQLIDGALSRLGSPKYGIVDMMVLETGEFLAVFRSGKLVRFTWDPDLSAVPEQKLTIYSLEESYDVRVAASAYQVQNPEVFVEYEVGVEDGSAVTREDALKALNTRIVAGQGPDLLILDGLPMDSYIEKGLLSDLSDFVEEAGEELFTNLIRALEKDGGIYMIPAQVDFPVILGKEKYVSGMKDLAGIAQEIEKLREDNPGKDLLGVCSEKGIMKSFAAVSAPAWKKENGDLDREAVSEFLVQMKRVWQAQMDGINQESVDRYNDASLYSARDYGEDWVYNVSFYGGMSLDYVGGSRQILAGVTTYPYGYYDLTSVHKAKGFEDARLIPMEGQCSGVFIPQTMLGVSATTSQKELALDFLKLFCGKENQVALGGFSINREALKELFTPESEYLGANGEYGAISMIDEEGLEVSMDVYLPDEEELATFYDWMESSDTPYIEDLIMEKAVFEEGSGFVLDEVSLEEALNALEQRVAIYMAE